MPLYKTIQHDATTKILLWKITESYNELIKQVHLEPANVLRVSNMKSQLHQRAFLCVRKLFMEIGHTDADLYYDAFGKPHLKNEKFISITHSHDYAAIIISNQAVGIDIELQREKITRIANKFSKERVNKKEEHYIQNLTRIWGAKEAIFKIKNEKGISFKDHITVAPFESNANIGEATLHFQSKTEKFDLHFIEIENFSLVYVLESKNMIASVIDKSNKK
jgi:4'-phosphopantetheinyl transferase